MERPCGWEQTSWFGGDGDPSGKALVEGVGKRDGGLENVAGTFGE